MEAKQREARTKQEQAVQDIIDKIQTGTPLSEIDQSLDPEKIKQAEEAGVDPSHELDSPITRMYDAIHSSDNPNQTARQLSEHIEKHLDT